MQVGIKRGMRNGMAEADSTNEDKTRIPEAGSVKEDKTRMPQMRIKRGFRK